MIRPKSIQIDFQHADSKEDLAPEDQILFSKAIAAFGNAYAPYSNYRVGSAVLYADGHIVTGCNQENMAYPSGLCAERVALFAGASLYPDSEIVAIAVAVERSSPNSSISPCGACRQVMIEFESKQKKPIRVISGASQGAVDVYSSVKQLLPMSFYDENLEGN